ncbi:hypothetical protein ACHAWF_018716 [Thalassiosira exigua]
MKTAIDFRELRRQERRRVRSSKINNDCVSGTDADGFQPAVALPPPRTNNVDHPMPTALQLPSPSLQDDGDLAPYDNLLYQNQLPKEAYRIGSPSSIDSVFYSKEFLSHDQAEEILHFVRDIPKYFCCDDGTKGTAGKRLSEREESVRHNGKWTRLKHARRKVALFDGTICSLPPILLRLSKTLRAIGAFPPSSPPNHVLVNEYQPGEGIMPHTDGPAYESCSAIISLGGSDVIFKLRPRQLHTGVESDHSRAESQGESLDIVLAGQGSILLFTNDAYLNFTHQIDECLEETTNDGETVVSGYRVSLTFRCKK